MGMRLGHEITRSGRFSDPKPNLSTGRCRKIQERTRQSLQNKAIKILADCMGRMMGARAGTCHMLRVTVNAHSRDLSIPAVAKSYLVVAMFC